MNLAERCFNENLQLIGRTPAGLPRDPIAWNTNAGLAALAQQVAALQSELLSTQARIHDLARQLPLR